MTTLAAILGALLVLLQPHAHAQRCDDIRQQLKRSNTFERLAWQAEIDAARNGAEDEARRWERIRAGHERRITELTPLAVSCGIVPSTAAERKTPLMR